MHPRRPPNRLAGSSSPYLLQHAHNPVDWYPWGAEAFDQARRRDVPIFLSIGYATCHWCHVMERESFEDEATAKLMNERFVCVKLDREERPDVDELYMAATVAMHGHGGWPMSVFLEPRTLRPFYCGTYYPREERPGSPPAFRRVLMGMSVAYAERRDEVTQQSEQLASVVREQVSPMAGRARLDARTVERALSSVLAMFDPVRGGFGVAPKFPQVVFLECLLDARGNADATTVAAIDRCVRVTLDSMARGGLHDHVAGGFHRYCVDGAWSVPHFEKMLYDQAQMMSVYARAAREYGDAWYAWVARRVERYVRRRLSDPSGGFLSAEDAEVQGREGAHCVWTPQRMRNVLGEEDARTACAWFGLDGPSNFRDPHHPEEPASWVLRLRERAPGDGSDERYLRVLDALERDREARPMPRLDDKVVACWNGMMLHAMMEPGCAGGPLRSELARVLDRLDDRQGGIFRCARGDVSHTPALLEDYAAMTSACVRAGLLDRARRLLDRASSLFRDESGVWYDTRASEPDLFVRAHTTHDGACPCGFSMMLHAMLDLAQRTGEVTHAETCARALHAASERIDASPAGSVNSVRALLRLLREWGENRKVMDALNPPGATFTSRADETSRCVSGSESVVRVYSPVERVTLARETPAEIWLRFEVGDGWHVVLACEDEGAVSALRIDVSNGSGVRAYADPPAGEEMTFEDKSVVRVARGEFDVRVALEREGDWSGTPVLTASFQACSADSCLRPATVELDISLDRA